MSLASKSACALLSVAGAAFFVAETAALALPSVVGAGVSDEAAAFAAIGFPIYFD